MSKKLGLRAVLSFLFFAGVFLVAQDNSRNKSENPPTFSITLNIKFREKEAKKPENKETTVSSSTTPEVQPKNEIESISSCGIPKEQSYSSGTSFSITLKKMMPGDPSFKEIAIVELDSSYLVELLSEESKLAEIPVRTGAFPTPVVFKGEVPAINVGKYECSLKEAGKKYTLKITKYNSFEDKLKGKDGGIPIFQKDFITNHKYYVGLDVGWFFPGEATGKSYNLFYKNPSDDPATAKQTLEENTYYQTKAIVYVSIFPAGFEPEGSMLTWRRVHFNVGTELSKSILDKLYLGVGYDLNFLSANLLLGIGYEDSLPDDYQNWIGKEIPNSKIGSIPFIKKTKVRWSFAISLPFNFASTIGKIFGL